jgi:hypothetical protein
MDHHAYLYEGPLVLLKALGEDARDRFGFAQEHDPDVSVREWEKFGIEEARQLADLAALKSASGKALFVLGVASMTTEAQQALLKLFEEPQRGSIFVLLLPHGVLLPTLRSRFLPYPEKLKQKEKGTEARKFLSMSQKERSEWIGEFLEEEEGARERVRVLFDGLERELYVRVGKKPSKDLYEGLEDLSQFREYLGDRAPSLKMLLEHLALSLPKVS